MRYFLRHIREGEKTCLAFIHKNEKIKKGTLLNFYTGSAACELICKFSNIDFAAYTLQKHDKLQTKEHKILYKNIPPFQPNIVRNPILIIPACSYKSDNLWEMNRNL